MRRCLSLPFIMMLIGAAAPGPESDTGAAIVNHGAPGGIIPCKVCHGMQLQGNRSIGSPALAGLPQATTLAALQAIGSGKQGNNFAMQKIAHSLTPAQRKVIAAYLAGLQERARIVTQAVQRRSVTRALAGLGTGLLLAGCDRKWKLDPQDIAAENSFQPLKFSMTDANTGKPITQAEFRNKIVMLYFGYTNCPNVCPLTLTYTAQIFHRIGAKAKDVRFLFVTVDPRRDTLPILKKYVALFGSKNIIGLRGSEAELKAAAARCKAGYTVQPSPDPTKYTVTHTSLVYVFNRQGKPEFMIAGLSSRSPDMKGIAKDLTHVVTANTV